MSIKSASLLVRLTYLLSDAQRSKRCLYYSDVAKMLGGHSPRSIHLARALGSVVAADKDLNQPLKSSLVIRNDTKMPGDGYFWILEELGLIPDHTDVKTCRAFWLSQMKALGVTPPAV